MGDIFVFRDFRIGFGAVTVFILTGAGAGVANANVHRDDFPGRSHYGRFVVAPASYPAPAAGAREQHSDEAALPDPTEDSPVAGPAGSGCETPNPEGTPFCVHPGLLKSRGQ